MRNEDFNFSGYSIRPLKWRRFSVEKIFKELLPHLQQQWNSRQKRPLPDSVNFAISHFKNISTFGS